MIRNLGLACLGLGDVIDRLGWVGHGKMWSRESMEIAIFWRVEVQIHPG